MLDVSKVGIVYSSDLSQGVITVPFVAPSLVAGCSEPTPDRASVALCSVCLGTTLGGLVATVMPTGSSLPPPLRTFLVILRVLESSWWGGGGFVPDAFLASLRCKVVFLAEHSFASSGDSIANLVASLRVLCAYL